MMEMFRVRHLLAPSLTAIVTKFYPFIPSGYETAAHIAALERLGSLIVSANKRLYIVPFQSIDLLKIAQMLWKVRVSLRHVIEC